MKNYSYWSISLFILTTVSYETYPWSFDREYGASESIIIFVASRTLWSASITWMIWACVTSNGGFINKFLSWNFWVVLSRLSYSVYLTHAWSILILVGTARSPFDTSVYSFVSQSKTLTLSLCHIDIVIASHCESIKQCQYVTITDCDNASH